MRLLFFVNILIFAVVKAANMSVIRICITSYYADQYNNLLGLPKMADNEA